MAQMGTLAQVKREWTIDDLLDAHELLDMKEQAEADQMDAVKRR